MNCEAAGAYSGTVDNQLSVDTYNELLVLAREIHFSSTEADRYNHQLRLHSHNDTQTIIKAGHDKLDHMSLSISDTSHGLLIKYIEQRAVTEVYDSLSIRSMLLNLASEAKTLGFFGLVDRAMHTKHEHTIKESLAEVYSYGVQLDTAVASNWISNLRDLRQQRKTTETDDRFSRISERKFRSFVARHIIGM